MTEILEKRKISIDAFIKLVPIARVVRSDIPVVHGIGYTQELEDYDGISEARTAKPLKDYMH